MIEIGVRAKQILYHAVTEYVANGEPVGSRTLAKKLGMKLSPASIRNVLSDLEEAGYLQQPHTSAGRVPTAKAFRLFIDALMQVRQLSQEDAGRIRERLEGADTGPGLLRETGKLLSELTGTAALVVSPKAETLKMQQMRFIRISGEQILAVLVLTNGTVQNRFIQASTTEAELSRIHNLLDDVIEGRSLGELRDLFAKRLSSERVQHDDLRRRAFELGDEAIRGVVQAEKDVVIEGSERLFEAPDLRDGQGARLVMSVLDARDQLVSLLDATLGTSGSTVVVGGEVNGLGAGRLAIVGAAYKSHGQSAGAIGVIGPTRMDYPSVVPLVTATATAMSEVMDKKER